MCAQERQDEEKVANEEGNAITLITYRILSFFFFSPSLLRPYMRVGVSFECEKLRETNDEYVCVKQVFVIVQTNQQKVIERKREKGMYGKESGGNERSETNNKNASLKEGRKAFESVSVQ